MGRVFGFLEVISVRKKFQKNTRSDIKIQKYIFHFFSYKIDFQERKDPSHCIPGKKMAHFDVKTIVLAQKL